MMDCCYRYQYQVKYSAEDGEYVGLCVEFQSMSWLDVTSERAFERIQAVVRNVVSDMQANGEAVPEPELPVA
ncbi:HicB [Pandoraea anapnoica]|uniref:HicB n=1 Tax=Pandoraea anapnoica TaxID=2508301 RepID=A0A5E4ZZH2_9BURK|nr:HicB [Pandoraea anapnoica]